MLEIFWSEILSNVGLPKQVSGCHGKRASAYLEHCFTHMIPDSCTKGLWLQTINRSVSSAIKIESWT